MRAAAELAVERGVTATTTAEVCKRSGLPISSLYWHFGDKDQMFAEVIRAGFAGWAARVTLPRPDESGSTEDFLRSLLSSLAFREATIPEFVVIGLEVLLDKRESHQAARAAFVEARSQWQRMFVAWLTESLGVSETSKLGHALAVVSMAFSEGMIINMRLDDAIKIEQQIEIMTAVMSGMLAGHNNA